MLPVCQPCQIGKCSKLQFFSSRSVVSEPRSYSHCDLWGPSPVVSNQGFKFYVVFVDEPMSEKISRSLPTSVLTQQILNPPHVPEIDSYLEELEPLAPVVEEQPATNLHPMRTRGKVGNTKAQYTLCDGSFKI